MFCPNCGKEIPNDSNFCPNCQSKILFNQNMNENLGNISPKIINPNLNINKEELLTKISSLKKLIVVSFILQILKYVPVLLSFILPIIFALFQLDNYPLSTIIFSSFEYALPVILILGIIFTLVSMTKGISFFKETNESLLINHIKILRLFLIILYGSFIVIMIVAAICLALKNESTPDYLSIAGLAMLSFLAQVFLMVILAYDIFGLIILIKVRTSLKSIKEKLSII
ncbi:MAG: zinc-ribbon domain-containing protein [Succinivibrionaceae bacterium]|nr:zinc-ribbon domain-containing protein [Succinivibrionaceae bacterium]